MAEKKTPHLVGDAPPQWDPALVGPKSIPKRLLNYAYWILAKRPYSEAEFSYKLQTRKKAAARTSNTGAAYFTDEDIANLIQFFKERRYLNDEEFARIYTQSNLNRKPQGKRLLQQNLRQKGLSKEIIEQTLDAAAIDEFALAQQAAAKKLKILHEPNLLKRKEKLYRFLAGRGFTVNTILKVLQISE